MNEKLIRLKERIKAKYKGLKEYFLDRLKGYDTAPRFFERYGKRLGLDPYEMLVEGLDLLEKKGEAWIQKRVYERRQGLTTTVAAIAYFEAAIRRKEVAVVVYNEMTRRHFQMRINQFGGVDRDGKQVSMRLRILTLDEVERGHVRGKNYDIALFDRTGKEKKWFDALEHVMKQVIDGRIGRVIEFNQSLATE